VLLDAPAEDAPPRMRKEERRARILLELKLGPHVRAADLADRFGESSETVRRDFEALSAEGLVSRAHGGATAPAHRQYPGFAERSHDRQAERAAIGCRAAALVAPGDTVMIDSGSTTLELARFLAYAGTHCTVITNSLPIATAVGQGGAAEVILCAGDYLAAEAAVIDPDTIEYIRRFNVARCFIGASALAAEGVCESVRGFAAITRAMLAQSARAHLLVDGSEFDRTGLARVGTLAALASVVVDRVPEGELAAALARGRVEVSIATQTQRAGTRTARDAPGTHEERPGAHQQEERP
jgi:DeoR/GlpR family transcriptional regulator of sugar metabolism